MSDEQLAYASISEIGKLYRRAKLSPVELTRFILQRITRLNPLLNAYLEVAGEMALRQAKAADRAFSKLKNKSAPDLGALHGIPISLKDNIYTKGIRTTGGSALLREFVPTQDAPVVIALRNAGAIVLGKTNLHEFAYGTTSNNPHYGPVKNPWDTSRIAGGSSGGSAAALAAGLCYGSIGTDTGGSVRIPASLCGVVGLKPGLGRVSAEHVIPLSFTLDVVGPMARSARDAAILFEAIATIGPRERLVRSRNNASSRIARTQVGIPKEFFFELLETEVRRAFDQSVGMLKKRGAKIKEISWPLLQETEEAGNQIAWAEATLYHQDAGWYPARATEYGEDVRSRIEMGTKVSALNYLRALETRQKFSGAFQEVMSSNELDMLAVPTTPIAAPRIGQETISLQGKEHMTRALLLRLNRPANLAGIPAISVPCGRTASGLPIGLQFIGAMNSEPLLLQVADEFEQCLPADELRPALNDASNPPN